MRSSTSKLGLLAVILTILLAPSIRAGSSSSSSTQDGFSGRLAGPFEDPAGQGREQGYFVTTDWSYNSFNSNDGKKIQIFQSIDPKANIGIETRPETIWLKGQLESTETYGGDRIQWLLYRTDPSQPDLIEFLESQFFPASARWKSPMPINLKTYFVANDETYLIKVKLLKGNRIVDEHLIHGRIDTEISFDAQVGDNNMRSNEVSHEFDLNGFCSDPNSSVRIIVRKGIESKKFEADCTNSKHFYEVIRVDDIVEPGQDFSVNLDYSDRAGNSTQTLLQLSRKENAIQWSEHIFVGPELPNNLLLYGECSEVNGPVRFQIYNDQNDFIESHETSCVRGFLHSSLGGWFAYDLNTENFPPENSYAIYAFHRAPLDSPENAVAIFKTYDDSNGNQRPSSLQILTPSYGALSAGKPHFSGTCMADTIYTITNTTTPISNLLVSVGSKIASNKFRCSPDSIFDLEIDFEALEQNQPWSMSIESTDQSVDHLALYKTCPRPLTEIQDSNIPVDELYHPRDDGNFCLIHNESSRISDGERYFNVSYLNNGQIKTAQLPDPDIIKIGDTYYLLGTTAATKTANFIILSSKDLVSWKFHSLALEGDILPIEGNENSNRIVLRDRSFSLCSLWDPKFVTEGNVIHMYFTGVYDRAKIVIPINHSVATKKLGAQALL
ncbi:MAG: hypothetical protein COV44_00910 [Deltaproteobacteria bacterium CG11_big_fil_rev_8_21_14_0_20_45_16]|nr:MAG: hypothetical protein COV44_00910 [Deltaproteobacteria bacterium CG11_big_fil_rev_8_21_14_0_20_45_16]